MSDSIWIITTHSISHHSCTTSCCPVSVDREKFDEEEVDKSPARDVADMSSQQIDMLLQVGLASFYGRHVLSTNRHVITGRSSFILRKTCPLNK